KSKGNKEQRIVRVHTNKSDVEDTSTETQSTATSLKQRKNQKSKRDKKDKESHNTTTSDSEERQKKTLKDLHALYLLDVNRFPGPPVRAISFDESRRRHNNELEISHDLICQARPNELKPMTKNFKFESSFTNLIPKELDAYNLDKELIEFTNVAEYEQPTMYEEYIPEFFQKQAEAKQIRRISLTAVKPPESIIKRLGARIPRLFVGWEPSNIDSQHTDEFRPLSKFIMSNIAHYFDEDFIDETGMFQNPKQIDRAQPTAELRRKRVNIDFRELWFQDALSGSFYSYFDLQPEYQKKHVQYHKLASNLQKRLIRPG
ncbi:unnamed protein product, partial [Didymodactylos carnosus]